MATMTEAMAAWLAPYQDVTVVAYRSIGTQWLTWCRDNGIDPLHVTRTHVEIYERWRMQHLGQSAHTVATHLGALGSLYDTMLDMGLVTDNPVAKARRPRLHGRSQGSSLNRDEAAVFLRAAREADAQTRALCTLLLLTGMRVGEALGLDVEDVVDGEPMRLRVHRKGDWEQVVAVASEVRDALLAHIGRRRHGAVFRASEGGRLSTQRAGARVKMVAAHAGRLDITPHSLRRTFCTLARDAGVPDREIMAAAGWSSAHMLDYYDMAARGAAEATVGRALSAWLDHDTPMSHFTTERGIVGITKEEAPRQASTPQKGTIEMTNTTLTTSFFTTDIDQAVTDALGDYAADFDTDAIADALMDGINAITEPAGATVLRNGEIIVDIDADDQQVHEAIEQAHQWFDDEFWTIAEQHDNNADA